MIATLTRPTPDPRLDVRHVPPPLLRDGTLPPIDDVTRRDLLKGIGALGAGWALAGCGADGQQAAAPSPAATTRIIEHKYGTTEISGTPERVVTVGFIDHDGVLALGIVPVGLTAGEYSADQPYGVWPWAQDELGGGQPEVLPDTEVNFERIAALRPDLILAVYSGITDQDYEKLSRIAPTVAQSGEHPEYGTPWDEMTRVIGRALGKEERAEERIAEVEARFAEARQQHPEFNGKAAVYAGRLEAGGYYAETKGSSRVGVLTSLGFTIPDEIRSDKFYAEISREQIGLFDSDVLVWELGEPQARTAIESDPLYQQLDVTREGRDVFIEDKVLAGGMALISVLSLPLVVDELVPQLAAAVDGDPATKATRS